MRTQWGRKGGMWRGGNRVLSSGYTVQLGCLRDTMKGDSVTFAFHERHVLQECQFNILRGLLSSHIRAISGRLILEALKLWFSKTYPAKS